MLLQMKRLEDQNLALALQLETCTGRPASDWGSIPATPSDLTLPHQASLSPVPIHCWMTMLVSVSTTLLDNKSGVGV